MSQFIDPAYVHILRDTHLAFSSRQMESPNHLFPGADHVLAEAEIAMIISLQNQQTKNQAQPLDLISLHLDRNQYPLGDIPRLTLELMNRGTKEISGSVSSLVCPPNKSDGEWVARAPEVPLKIPAENSTTLTLEFNAGKISQAGNYNLVVFLRQNVGVLSHETRIESNGSLVVNNSLNP